MIDIVSHMTDEVLWKRGPSQWTNFGKFLIGLVFVAGIGVAAEMIPFRPAWYAVAIPLLWMLWKYLVVRCEVYELSEQRLRLYTGVLNQKIDEMELYRVKDVTLERPLILRIVGLSNLHLETSDRSHPEVVLKAVAGAVESRETLRKQVEFLRDKKRVREVDFEGGDMDDDGDLEGMPIE